MKKISMLVLTGAAAAGLLLSGAGMATAADEGTGTGTGTGTETGTGSADGLAQILQQLVTGSAQTPDPTEPTES